MWSNKMTIHAAIDELVKNNDVVLLDTLVTQ